MFVPAPSTEWSHPAVDGCCLGVGVSLFPHEAVCLFLFLKKYLLVLAVMGFHHCSGFTVGVASRGSSPLVQWRLVLWSL